MTAPFANALLGWKTSKGRLVPNTADTASSMSMRLAAAVLENLGVEAAESPLLPRDPGSALEQMTRRDLQQELLELAPERAWDVHCGVLISRFQQYRHLDALDQLVRNQPALRVTIGTDYMIKPDVTVGISRHRLMDRAADPAPFLHAVISCKWTIRSDRVQNIRHEFGQMIRHRRGRQPHLVTLTAEPLPTRLASIARGTGEVDATYHVAFDALAEAVRSAGNQEQQNAWNECVAQGRLKPYDELAPTLAAW
ncbi:restriction endonuclease [Aeromicrobium phragmitis]|uniref:Restriction endonuclease n=1 Tax=Aeromicrobium phragmitis TaxID=2478914 RepID=A0A3L8PN12_9ACTN|nr:NgoMIV family type II restriction endonuclease [Aeromicrobium phragmitis]RLV56755.1 restriction endonuclease [Aeromicrobium phragmitis]